MKTIAIIFGGQSSEHPVSLMSATSILNNLSDKYNKYLVGITKEGKWYHYSGAIENIENDKWEEDINNQEVILTPNRNMAGFYNLATNCIDKIDVVFPILHGRYGEDGTIQGVCQLAGIKMVSDDLQSCAIAMDKEYTHIICESHGIKMAKYQAVKKSESVSFEQLVDKLGLPMYVKPAREGSSFGAHKINNKEDFVRYSADAFSYDNKILYEEFIDGTEVGAAVLGENQVGEVFEVIVESEMYGFEEKYDGYKTNIYYPAKNLDKQQREQVNQIAKKIVKIIGADVLARVDFFNSSKGLIFCEANLIPGFTSHSLYPSCYKAAGVSYSDLLDRLIDMAK